MKYVGKVQSQANAEVYATASGTLPNGKPVVVNSNGTVSVASATNISQTLGSPAVFESAESAFISSAFDSNLNKVVIAYSDKGDSSYGKAVIGTVSGTSVSFGTPVVFHNASGVAYTSTTFDSNSNKVVIAFQETANGTGKAIVGTVSGTSISFGNLATFDSGVNVTFISATFDSSNNKVVIGYKDGNNNNYGTAIVGTVSGTTISFGTAVVFFSGESESVSAVFDSSNNKVVIFYREGVVANSGRVRVGTVSGTGISFGSEVTFNSTRTEFISSAYDTSSGKIVVAYANFGNSQYGTSIVGTVSGTGISFGTAVVFEAATVFDTGTAYDPSAQKVAITYRDNGNSNYGTLAVGTVSGTAISFGTPVVFEAAYSWYFAPVYDSNAEKVLILYQDVGNSQYGTGRVLQNASTSTNLTAENYVGITNGVVDYDEGTAAIGSAVVFESAEVDFCSATFDSNSNKVVVVYRDKGNSSSGTAAIGTISGTSITFGTPVIYRSGANTAYNDVVFDSNSNKVVVVYADYGNSGRGAARVGTVSGTTISFGTEVVFETGAANEISMAFDSNLNKVVITYSDGGDSNKGKAIVGTVSGTDISFGTAAVFEAGGTSYTACVYDENAQKFLIAYRDAGNSNYATAIVGTVSGTNISFGTAVVIESAGSYPASPGGLAYDPIAQKSVLLYFSGSSGKVVVGTISGTNVSFGTAVSFSSNAGSTNSLVYDSTAKVVVFGYRDGANSNYGTYRTGSVSGTSITVSAATVFEAASSASIAAAFDSNSKRVVALFRDQGNSNYGTATVIQVPYDNTVRGSTASGSTAIIQAGGAVNTLQTGLTPGQQYFVQTDGTLGLTAATPSVIAGTAVSATDLIVKG